MRTAVVTLLLASASVVFSQTVAEQIAAPLLEAGWFEVECESVFAMPDEAARVELQRQAGTKLVVCVRNHDYDEDAVAAAVRGVVPHAEAEGFPGLLVSFSADGLQVLGVSASGAVMIVQQE